MKIRSGLYAAAVSSLLFVSGSALANDLEGKIESIDADQQTFMVQGITFHVSGDTDYDDGLKRFEDLKEGQKVEVDFEFRDGRHHATEIELDD